MVEKLDTHRKPKPHQKQTCNLSLISRTEINSKWPKGLSAKHKTIKLLEKKNTEEKLWDIGLGKQFSHLTPNVFVNP